MKFKELRVLKCGNKVTGLDGDLYVHYAVDPVSELLIGICPNFTITISSEKPHELFSSFGKIVEQLFGEMIKEKNIDRWAQRNGIQVRHVPNMRALDRKRPKMPSIYFIEEESMLDLEKVVRK